MPAALPPLAFPAGAPFDLQERAGVPVILDRVRRRYVRLTPEEWVRQHLLRTMIDSLGYPVGLISLEPTLATVAGSRRPDVVAYDRGRRPILIAECKAPSVRITQPVFEQVSRYNTVTGAPVLLITNGLEHVCWRVDRTARTHRFLDTLPSFADAG